MCMNMIVLFTRCIQLPGRHEGFQNLTKVSDALHTFLDAIGKPRIRLEFVSIDQSLGRILGADIIADRFIPPTDRAVMDGYAVRSSEVHNAAEGNPVVLRIVGESKIGEVFRLNVQPGQAVAVATGSSIPSGADAVVMDERTKLLSTNEVAILTPSAPGQHISRRGEDVSRGAVVLIRGRRIRAQDMGVLKALGLVRVRVVRKPRVAVFSTGNELTDMLQRDRPNKIVDINRLVLSEMIWERGGIPVDLGLVRGDEEEIMAALRKGLRSREAVVATAGSSVGEKDLVPACINKLGKPGMLVHGIAMRPAMPTGLAVVNGKPILSLPGFPVSAIFGFRVFGRPLIARLLGSEVIDDPVVKAVLREKISNSPGFRAFVRVALRRTPDGLIAEPLRVQRSSVLMSMVAANGIIVVPEDVAAIEAGQVVEVDVIGEISY